MDEIFTIPDHMEPQIVADTMAAYLLGDRAFENTVPTALGMAAAHPGERRHGPYQQDGKWQLDDSNDFWLRIDGDHGRLTCRYPSQIATIQAMKLLFNSRYLRAREAIFS